MAGNLNSYLLHLGGACNHILETIPCLQETHLKTLVLFSWCVLTRAQNSPHETPFLNHVPTAHHI